MVLLNIIYTKHFHILNGEIYSILFFNVPEKEMWMESHNKQYKLEDSLGSSELKKGSGMDLVNLRWSEC